MLIPLLGAPLVATAASKALESLWDRSPAQREDCRRSSFHFSMHGLLLCSFQKYQKTSKFNVCDGDVNGFPSNELKLCGNRANELSSFYRDEVGNNLSNVFQGPKTIDPTTALNKFNETREGKRFFESLRTSVLLPRFGEDYLKLLHIQNIKSWKRTLERKFISAQLLPNPTDPLDVQLKDTQNLIEMIHYLSDLYEIAIPSGSLKQVVIEDLRFRSDDLKNSAEILQQDLNGD